MKEISTASPGLTYAYDILSCQNIIGVEEVGKICNFYGQSVLKTNFYLRHKTEVRDKLAATC